jgi:t-SNARE complex subunit (syntaxin)
LNIAAQTIKTAKQKFKEGRGELVEANKYQQEAGKSKLFLCLLIIILLAVILLVMLAANKQ